MCDPYIQNLGFEDTDTNVQRMCVNFFAYCVTKFETLFRGLIFGDFWFYRQ